MGNSQGKGRKQAIEKLFLLVFVTLPPPNTVKIKSGIIKSNKDIIHKVHSIYVKRLRVLESGTPQV